MSILYNPGKANFVFNALRRLSTSSTTHFGEDKKELERDVHRLARLRVRLLDSIEGVVVMNEVESSLVSKVKVNQYQDPIFLELTANAYKQNILAFEQMEYGVLRY